MKNTKYVTMAFAGILVVSLIAFAHVKADDRLPFSISWPSTGMPIPELEKALSEIKPLIPAGPGLQNTNSTARTNVLDISILNSQTIRIRTGIQYAPRSGRGRQFEFRKVDGKWNLAGDMDWVS